jgi:hypothetical protein
MLPEEVKRKAIVEAQKLKISFADFVRQAIAEKLPHRGEGASRLRRRQRDPLFRLLDHQLPIKKGSAKDVAARHDDYLYGPESEFAGG